VRDEAKVIGRRHDKRHALVTELSESGECEEVVMSIPGHVSRSMLSRYSHVRMEAKPRALDEIAARQRAADGKRKVEAERRQQAAVFSQLALVQYAPAENPPAARPDRSSPRSPFLGNCLTAPGR
jgi:hypothetical protein